MTATHLIGLAGPPNSGKSSLFNSLTGHRQKVGNYPGVTVEKKMGEFEGPSKRPFQIIDLPGTYSLDAHSPEEVITRDILLDLKEGERSPDIVIAVADATNLERSLSLVLELIHINKPVVLALNRSDLAQKRGLDLDLPALSHELGIPVVPTVATKNYGLDLLIEKVEGLELPLKSYPAQFATPTAAQVRERFSKVDEILSKCLHAKTKPDFVSRKIDRVVLHPFFGLLILAFTLIFVFQAVFSWAAPAMEAIEGMIEALSGFLLASLPAGDFRDLLVNGIIAGVGSVVVFLPQILILFAFILILEETGYMARAAFLLDRTMGRLGLHGRAFIPLLSSFACAIPGIMATRTIESKKDRLATILVAPLMTCSARLPVYTLLIAAFIPNQSVGVGLNLQGLVMFALYMAGIFSALLVAFIFKKSALKGPTPPLLLEMPTYQIPNARNVVSGLYTRAKIFLKRAGTLIFAVAVMIWFLASYPKIDHKAPPIEESFAGKIGLTMVPLLKPIGFNWQIATGLIPGFAAREVMVGSLATIYSIEADSEETTEKGLSHILSSQWSLATALALLAWYIFAPQCLATFAVMKRETGSWKWTSIGFIYLLALAYLAAFVVFRGATYFGLGA